MPVPTLQDIEDVRRYLNVYRIEKEKRGIIQPTVTGLSHVAGGMGSFHIPEEEYEQFLENIASFIFHKHVPLGLVERPYTDESGQVYTPMKIDLDFRFDIEPDFIGENGQPIRQYDDKMIQAFVQAVWDETIKVSSFEGYTKETVTFYVLRKPHPELDIKKGETEPSRIKDGVHIVAKDLMILPLIQFYIRKQVIRKMNDIFPDVFFKQTTRNDIYDESVICRSGWMIHGNRKEGKQPYNLWFRQVYTPQQSTDTTTLNEPTIFKKSRRSPIDDRELVKTLSVRFGITDMGITPLESAAESLQAFFEKNSNARNSARLGGATNPRSPGEEGASPYDNIVKSLAFPEDMLNSDRTDSLKSAAWLVDMLSSSCATPYDTWIRVGICLRNMSRIEGLPDVRRGSTVEKMADDHDVVVDNGMYNLWVAFSRKSTSYIEGMEDKDDWYNKYWLGFASRGASDSMLKRPSLRLWARHDSPERYTVFLSKDERVEIDRVISGGGTHVDLASLARLLYGDTFVCADIKANEWYEYQQSYHRFMKSDSATTLRAKLSRDIRIKFIKKHKEVFDSLNEQQSRESVSNIDSDGNAVNTTISPDVGEVRNHPIFKTIDRIIKSLATTKFLNDVIVECRHKFYETYRDEFLQKIDSNVNLIGFTNGVLDLTTCTFRPGRPDDMISKTTGYEYTEYDEDDDKIQRIMSVFEKIYTNPEVREYMWAVMATNLKGENWLQQIYFLNGTGANGKSLLTKWLAKAFGDYAIKGNVSLLTEKRSNSQSASPEIAKLKGMRFVYMEEPDDMGGTMINHALLKELTGDANLTGRALHKDPIEFPITFKIWFACNEFPKITSEDATWRRLRVVEHTSTFLPRGRAIVDPVKQFYRDEKLMSDEYVKEHRTALMAILVNYFRSYWLPGGIGRKSSGFNEPTEVQAFSSQIRMGNDPVAPFFEPECQLFTIIDQMTFETEYKMSSSKIREELLDESKIQKAIKKEISENSGTFHGSRSGRGKGIGRNIKKRDIVNYLDNIRGIRKVQAKEGDTKWYYLVKEYDSSIDGIENDNKNIRTYDDFNKSMLVEDDK
jgi:P4 family phage/plasmid primase-like protien